jgi:hypothetical protein
MMRKLIIPVTAASLVIAGITVPAVSASAAPGTSPACTAAIQNRNELRFRIKAENEEIAQYNQLEAKETADREELGTLTSLKKTVEEALTSVVANIAAGKLGALAERAAIGLEAADILSLGFYAVEIRSANSSLTDVEDQLNDSFGLTDMANINGLMAELSAANAAVTSACQGMATPAATPTTPAATPTTPAATPTATPSGTSSGGTQQYYQNGATFVLLDDGIVSTVAGGSVQADCAETAADPGADYTGNSGAGRAGNSPEDTGPTVADQTAWISGCVAQENAYPVSVLSSVTPAATTPAATTPAATTPAATTPAATTPAATTPAATTPAATTARV